MGADNYYSDATGMKPNPSWSSADCMRYADLDRKAPPSFSSPSYTPSSVPIYTPVSPTIHSGSLVSGSGSDGGGVILFIVLGAVFYGLYRLYLLLCSWAEMASPNREVAAFYYYTAVAPLEFVFNAAMNLGSLISSFWHLAVTDGLTQYQFLNITIACGGILLAAATIMMAGIFIFGFAADQCANSPLLRKTIRICLKIGITAFIAPGLLLLIYSVYSNFTSRSQSLQPAMEGNERAVSTNKAGPSHSESVKTGRIKAPLGAKSGPVNNGIRPRSASAGIKQPTTNGKLRILYKEKAVYTAEARANKVQGEVLLSILFASNGRIEDIQVVRSLPDGLTESAIQAARKIRFKPAVKNGEAIDVRVNLVYGFNLY